MKKLNLIRIDLDKTIVDLVKKSDHKTLGIWAADCVERVLQYFEEKYPEDNRPRKAIEVLRTWIENGIFKMADIRKYSLAAHAAAREVKENDIVARFVARAAGQAVATAHVPTHSIGAVIYIVTAIRDATGSINEANKERNWQYKHLVNLNKTFGITKSIKQTLWRGFCKQDRSPGDF